MLQTKLLEKTQDQVSFVYLISIALSVLVIYIVSDGLFRDREARKNQVFRQVGTVADLAVDDVARSLAGVRDSLRLLARLPAFRQAAQAGSVLPRLRSIRGRAEAAIDGVVQAEIAFERAQKRLQEDLQLYLETARASGRRVLYALHLWNEPVEPLSPALPEDPDMESSAGTSAPAYQGDDAYHTPVTAELLLPAVENLIIALVPSVTLIDRLFPVGLPTLADPLTAENILRASISDRDLIRSVSVKQLDGQEIIGVTEIAGSFQMLANWVKSATRAARSFYSGPVWFEEGLGRPIWNVAVPLRDEDREPFAMLSSQVDLGFLGDLAQKTRLTSTSHLLVVDDDGVVIAHPKTSMVANQVNLSHSNRAVAEAMRGEEGVQELRLGDTTFVVAYRSLKKVDAATLPAWGILYLTPLSEAIGSFLWDAANALVLIAGALYLIFWCAGIVIDVLEEGEV